MKKLLSLLTLVCSINVFPILAMEYDEKEALERALKESLNINYLTEEQLIALAEEFSLEDVKEAQQQEEAKKAWKIKAGEYHEQGVRPEMEDASVIQIPLFENNPHSAVFAVFDGHGGNEVAEFAAQSLVQKLRNGYEHTQNGETLLSNVLKKINQEIFNENLFYSKGSTAIIALLLDDKLTIANLGDSRAILSKNGKAIPLSEDHNLSNPKEKDRIKKINAETIENLKSTKHINSDTSIEYITKLFDNNRLMSELSVSRALGDEESVYAGLIDQPEIRTITINPSEDVLILACDGIFEGGMSNQDAVNSVIKALEKFKTKDNAEELAAQELVNIALTGIEHDQDREKILEHIQPLLQNIESQQRLSIIPELYRWRVMTDLIETPKFEISRDNLSALVVTFK